MKAQGFFEGFEEIVEENIVRNRIKKSKRKVSPKVLKNPCGSCKLNTKDKSPKRKPEGKGKEKILFLFDAPNLIERGSCFLEGDRAKFLRSFLKKQNLDLDEDCWCVYSVRCFSKKKTDREIKLCQSFLHKFIEENKPEKIIIFGVEGLKALIGNKVSVTNIVKWIGWKIPDQEKGAWIYPINSIQYVKDNSDIFIIKKEFEDQLEAALCHFEPFPDYLDIKNKVEIINNSLGATIFLESLWPKNEIAFDFETTGLKPYAEGHEIKFMSVCSGTDKVVAFPIFDDDAFRKALRKVLQGTRIKKIAQNLKFESSWTKKYLGYSVKGWSWDTMIASHVLDFRDKISGLKFQSYINFGIVGYEDSVEGFLKSNSKDNNAFNSIDLAEADEVMEYCALDSLFTFMLYEKQREEMGNKRGRAFNLFFEGMIELGEVEQNGICTDDEYYEAQYNHLERRLKSKKKKLQEKTKEGKLWIEKENKLIDIGSSNQLKKLFYEYLDLKVVKYTAKGNASVDQEALEQMDIVFVRELLEYRKLDKLKNTYLEGFVRESVGGFLHPNFNLHTTKTYRSSSSAINFQNIPVRDEYAMKVTRKGIIPRPGRQLMEVDYSGIEVRISVCYHHDPVMIDYINNPLTDMHRDQACELFLADKSLITKWMRFYAKNGFVFPEFYGDYYRNCAMNIWENIKELKTTEDIYVREHLKNQGIKSYKAFEKHVMEVEDVFWNEKFMVYRDWKDAAWNDYCKKGYIDFLTGFRCKGVLLEKHVYNYPIQGVAFHILLWSLIHIQQELRKEKYETLIIGQIHDSILFDVVPEEKAELKKMVRKVMTEDVRKFWDFIIVPLDIDAECSAVDGNWAEMKDEKI